MVTVNGNCPALVYGPSYYPDCTHKHDDLLRNNGDSTPAVSIAVAEELHFGRAATRLSVSQPPLSRQIRQLEEELGVTLFHRTKREVRLTEAGARILNEAYHVLSDVDHLARVAARTGGGGIGHLSIGVPGGLNEIPIQALRIFAQQCPEVRIELKHMNTGSQVEVSARAYLKWVS